MTREEADRELIAEGCPCLYDMNELAYNGPERDWCVTERIARRDAEAQLADAKETLREIEASNPILREGEANPAARVRLTFSMLQSKLREAEERLEQSDNLLQACISDVPSELMNDCWHDGYHRGQATARAEALERAIKACKSVIADVAENAPQRTFFGITPIITRMERCVTAIRALKEGK